MLAARVATLSSCARQGIIKPQFPPYRSFVSSAKNSQNARAERFANRMGNGTAGTTTRPTTFKEKLMAPAGNNAFGVGRGLVAGGAALGIGALCFYGSGFSNSVGVREKAMMWPDYIKQRVKTTYLYFGGSLAISAATALAVFRTPALLRLVATSSWVGVLASMGLMIGSGIVCQSMPYPEGFGAKHVAWMVHSAIIGGVLAPMCFVGGPLLMRAATYTAGIVGGLSAIAVCAPSEKFLTWGAPLGMGLGVVFVSSLAGMFLPPTTVIGASLYSISVYGGLALFSGFMLYDTQKVMKRAELTPPNSYPPFDPINNSISIYLDAINIFIRMVMILGGGGGRRK